MTFVETLVSGITIAILSSWLTVRLAMNRFQNEKWWELKAKTYMRAIESLHHQKSSAKKHYEREVEQVPYSLDYLSNLAKQSLEGRRTLEEIVDTGSFILPTNVRDAIVDYNTVVNDPQLDYVTYFDTVCFEAQKCLDIIIPLARQDLSRKPFADVQILTKKYYERIKDKGSVFQSKQLVKNENSIG